MPFYKDHVYPHLVSNPKPIETIRQRVVPLAQGKVLEIGVWPRRELRSLRSRQSDQGLCPRTQSRNDPNGGATASSNGTGYRISGSAGRTNSLGGRQRRYGR